MAIRKPKQVRKRRGYRQHGYGRIGQHRKGGQRGGKGKTGGKKHDWTYVTAHDPDRFGKHGFHRHDKLRQTHTKINVGDIARNLAQFTEKKAPTKGTPISIDLAAHGYDKVLGAGRISIPLTISAPLFTHRAAEKIKAAGGKIKGTVQDPTKHTAPSLREAPKPAPKPKRKAKPAVKPKTKPTTKAKPKSATKAKPKSPKKTTTKKAASKPKSKSASKPKAKRATATKGKVKN
ncbi:MAG: uL15 family ribosomal protein [Promethearchaeota archaeon]